MKDDEEIQTEQGEDVHNRQEKKTDVVEDAIEAEWNVGQLLGRPWTFCWKTPKYLCLQWLWLPNLCTFGRGTAPPAWSEPGHSWYQSI